MPVVSILLSCKAAAPGTRWLLARTGAAVAVLHQSTAKRHPSGGQAPVHQISLGAFGFAWGKFPILAAPPWLDNGGLSAIVGQVAALRQGCSEFAPTQDKETNLILRYEGELFFT